MKTNKTKLPFLITLRVSEADFIMALRHIGYDIHEYYCVENVTRVLEDDLDEIEIELVDGTEC